jgi:hypothetical protein
MRTATIVVCLLMFLAMLGVALLTPTLLLADAGTSAAGLTTVVADVKVDLPKVDVDVDVDKDRAWYKNPLVIGLGVVIVVLLVALASRGGTTIIDRRH